MNRLNNAMEIFKILKKTNCGECRVPTCLAFAAAVFKGEKRLRECPHMEHGQLSRFEVNNEDSRTLERELETLLDRLQERVAAMDLAEAAQRLDATCSGDKVTIKVLGKDFSVTSRGQVVSDCHVHGWVTVPLLNYVLTCKGNPPPGNWVPFRELKNGATWSRLFAQRCEKPLKQVADTHTDLFEIMIQIFSARRAPAAFDSDIAVVLYPLPRVPMLICYWKPDGDLESSLNVFFDDTAEDNLDADSLYRLTAGLVIMFEKIAMTHGK
ncbi:MAG: DUF3786 domain-containing protein [Thermodesulfobacteriota bacterium]